MRRNIRLLVAYDGTQFAGWQVQPQQRTVQAEIERAIRELTGEPASVLSAGRTDSGVHAIGQVASFWTESPIPAASFGRALQTHLPFDIVVLESGEAPASFHATFSAIRKRYRYVIHNATISPPFLRHYAYQIRGPLDVEAMQRGARKLLGKHDFRAFETDYPNKATSVRTVQELTVKRTSGWKLWASQPAFSSPAGDEVEDFICLEIVADGFLYNMVRTIAGTLIHVGRGRWTENDVERILVGQSRQHAGMTAPACGLYLVKVDYD